MDYHTLCQNLEIGEIIRIRRSDKVTITEVKVVEFAGTKYDRSFRAPEIPTFRVEWNDPTRNRPEERLTRWCCALDIYREELKYIPH